jgi:chitin synthase
MRYRPSFLIYCPLQILCWELVSKRGGAWVLHYVKSAYAVTDTPDQVRASFVLKRHLDLTATAPVQVPELISQRRRWLNGSFFAAIHSTFKFHYIYRSSHSFARKFWIHIELLYQTFNLIFSWFALVRLFCGLIKFALTSFCCVFCTGKLLHLVLCLN